MTTSAMDRIRRALAPVLAALCLAIPVAVSVVDSSQPDRGPVFESGHERGACAHGHDHSICTQVAANAGASSESGRHGLHTSDEAAAPLAIARDDALHAEHFPPLGSRAPPVA